MNAIVFQSDFGLSDGAVAAMHGVGYTQNSNLQIFDLTHDIPQFDIWEASYRLFQTIEFWPKGTVFVSVVDPGVGSSRLSVAVETNTGHYIITPDNGTLTHIKKKFGLKEARLISEAENHNPEKELSYTFHGRDVYAYVGARLAAGNTSFEAIGEKIDIEKIVELPTMDPVCTDTYIEGTIDVLDIRYGSLWSNIPFALFKKLGFEPGDRAEVTIQNDSRFVYQNFIKYGKSFADVRIGECIVYQNSLHNMGVAINQGSFSRAYNIGIGINWKIRFSKVPAATPY